MSALPILVRVGLFLRSVLRWFMVAAVLTVAFFAFRFYWNDEIRQIQSELDLIAETGRPSASFSKNELICFTQHTGPARSQFGPLAKNVAGKFTAVLDSCGADSTCCDVLNSEVTGIIGLVRDNDITCASIYHFIFVLDNERSACFEMSRLKVSREVFKEDYRLNSHLAKVGDPYYKISALP